MHVMEAPNIDIKVLYDLLTSMTNNSVDKVKEKETLDFKATDSLLLQLCLQLKPLNFNSFVCILESSGTTIVRFIIHGWIIVKD